jgi:hypothetical protein
MRALSAAVLLFVINMIGLGGGPTTFGIVTTEMTNHYLAGTDLTALSCAKPAAAIAATCAAAAAHGIKMTTYLSTAIIPIAMLCFFLSRFTIRRDFERAETMPAAPMTTARLAVYMFIAGALPGGFLGNASKMFFKVPPHMLWLQGLIVGGIVGVVIAFMIAATGRSAKTAAA